MIRALIIFFFTQALIINLKAQSDFENRHIYAPISDFYYLDILPNMHYLLKAGMYGDNYVKGKYIIENDTLELISFDYLEAKYELSDFDRKVIENGFSRFLISDSLLIPLSRRELIPFSRSMKRDSTIVKEYIQNDGHVHFYLTFRSDSTFEYSTGSDRFRHSTVGTWSQVGNKIKLNPVNSDNLLHWICTDYQLTKAENYLIGIRYDNDDNLVEYHYFIGLKPAANKPQ